jgi:hypothetical protein
MDYEGYENDRITRHQLTVPAWAGIATAAAIGAAGLTFLYAKRLRPREDRELLGLRWSGEQAVTIGAPLEEVEAAWVRWCASGNAKLRDNYAIRFEPAPGARGTEVHLSGGGSKGATREELRRFKQLVETGEVPVSDGPGLWRPAQPAGDLHTMKSNAEVL